MPLSLPASPRQLQHVRRVTTEVYLREDGLWDVEATLVDHKTFDTDSRDGTSRPAGSPIHGMVLRLTMNTELTILAAEGSMDAVPFRGICETIAPSYAALVGLNLGKGFRQAVRERFGNTAGCTHLSELASNLPSAAIQALATRLRAKAMENDVKPFQLDRCHAQSTDGEVVRRYYPKWYRGSSATDSGAENVAPPLESTGVRGTEKIAGNLLEKQNFNKDAS